MRLYKFKTVLTAVWRLWFNATIEEFIPLVYGVEFNEMIPYHLQKW